MKFVISENKINDLIYNFFDKNYYPDYGWSSEFYKQEVERYNDITFYINDYEAYTYYKFRDGVENVLSMSKWLGDELTLLFNDIWIPVFKKWFENNSGLEVDTIDIW